MTLDDLEDQLAAVELLTDLRLAQERYDRLFGPGALARAQTQLAQPTDELHVQPNRELWDALTH